MSDDEEQRWLDALAGRPAGELSDAAGNEARALRGLISAHLREDTVVDAQADAVREAALIERARAEGLVSAKRVTAMPLRRRRWFIAGGSLAAAALLGSVVVGLYRSSPPPAETYRGVQGGTVRLESNDPAALKQELIRELKDAGVEAAGYDRLGRLGIDADLPKPISAPLREVLRRHRIPIPEDGALVIEIDTARAQ